jgi:hypothetical protein
MLRADGSHRGIWRRELSEREDTGRLAGIVSMAQSVAGTLALDPPGRLDQHTADFLDHPVVVILDTTRQKGSH